MFDNIGGKIKGLAKLVCWLGIIGSGICGIVFEGATRSNGGGLVIAIVGAVISWIGSFFIYGFGQLVENSDIIAEKIENLENLEE
jgi:hypothetical protein